MTDQPNPVTPLSYYDRSGETWLPMTRMISALAIVASSVSILSFLFRVGFSGWQFWAPGTARLSFGAPWQIFLESPLAVAAILILIGAILTSRLRGGRLLLLGGAMAFMILTLTLALFSSIYSVIQLARWGMPYAMFQASSTLMAALQRMLIPGLLWYFFRRPAVIELFQGTRS